MREGEPKVERVKKEWEIDDDCAKTISEHLDYRKKKMLSLVKYGELISDPKARKASQEIKEYINGYYKKAAEQLKYRWHGKELDGELNSPTKEEEELRAEINGHWDLFKSLTPEGKKGDIGTSISKNIFLLEEDFMNRELERKRWMRKI